MKQVIIIFLLFVIAKASTYAQDNCINYIKNVFEYQNSKALASANTISYMSLSVNTVIEHGINNEKTNSRQKIDLYRTKDQAHVYVDNYEIHSGKEISIVINHSQQLITCTKVDQNVQKQQDYSSILQMQEKSINGASLLLCKEIDLNDGSDRLIIIRPHSVFRERFAIKSIAYFIDVDHNYFTKIRVFYDNNSNNIVTTDYIYHVIEYDYKGSFSLKKRIEDYVFKRGNTLLDKYSFYQLNDLRDEEY